MSEDVRSPDSEQPLPAPGRDAPLAPPAHPVRAARGHSVVAGRRSRRFKVG